ncbi:MAG: outer membrane protein assembly factor BamB [Rhodoferax sp.]|nr:outer membrane protein assembly factor BamB [Rhodoferax sp.]
MACIKIQRAVVRVGMVIVAVVTMAACSGPERIKPVELGTNPALIGVRPVWNANIGSVRFPLAIKALGNSLFVAGSEGVVAEIDVRTGGDIWRTTVPGNLTAGVGTDGRTTAVVGRSNEVIALVAGRELWRQKLQATTLTAPLVAGARVFVLLADRSVLAFDAASGRKLWQQQRAGDPLVLGQAGIIMAVGDTLVTGLGGRLVGMNPHNGSVRWDTIIASSRGTNDVERLVDLVAGVSRLGEQVCVRAFQTMVACADADKGRMLWSKAANGATGLSGDAGAVYGSESDGKVAAWRRTDGERLWTSERLRFRSLSGPVAVGRSVVVGDETGLLHFLSREDGAPLNRVATDGSAVSATPVLVGETLIVVTQRGSVFAFRPD